MPDSNELERQHRALDDFGRAYDYDVTYMHEILQASPGAFAALVPVQAMSSFRDALPVDAHFIAGLTTMQVEDCGPCAQLSLRKAVEAGLPRTLLAAAIRRPDELPPLLRDVRSHVRAVLGAQPPDPEVTERLIAAYGSAGLAELAVCIAGARMYPTLKRGMGRGQVCERLTLDFA